MKKVNIFILILIMTGITACTEKDNSEYTDIPIVEAYLRPGSFLSLTVSRQIPFLSSVNYSSDDIDNLTITVSNNGTDHILKPLGDGRYCDSSMVVKEGERYDLSFVYNSKNVTAYTEVPLKPVNFEQSATAISVERMDSTFTPGQGGGGGGMMGMPEPFVLTWDNDDESYYIVVAENIEPTFDPVRDWGDDDRPEGRFRKAPTTSSGLEMRTQEFQYFGRHRLILYHVLPDYASLYNENTASSQNLTNPSTSIMNGYGIFTGLDADTLYLEVKEE